VTNRRNPARNGLFSALIAACVVLGAVGCAGGADQAEIKIENACHTWYDIYQSGIFAGLAGPQLMAKAAAEAAAATRLDHRWAPLSNAMAEDSIFVSAVAARKAANIPPPGADDLVRSECASVNARTSS
jgi:hypothetical protein